MGIILLALIALLVSSIICTVALIIIGYREQARVATEAANRNAGYWAESEATCEGLRLAMSSLEGQLQVATKYGGEMTRITRQALGVARNTAFEKVYDDVVWKTDTYGDDPLDAHEIDG